MACSGPNKELSYKQGDEVFEKIWKLLVEEHHIGEYDKPLKDGSYWKGFFYEDWKKSKEDLRKAVQEVFWIEDCQSF